MWTTVTFDVQISPAGDQFLIDTMSIDNSPEFDALPPEQQTILWAALQAEMRDLQQSWPELLKDI